MNNANCFQARATDWRRSLIINRRKTFMVFFSFIFIYLLFGFIVDLYIHGAFNQNNNFLAIGQALISFQIPPLATISMGIVAIIAIFITFAMYDRIMLMGTQYREITLKTAKTTTERQLYDVVEELKIAAGLRYMPKIFLINADYMNAFASGYSEKSAMVAITSGLLNKLNRSELQAVMAHELSHIRHGDIKLTLATSVLANLMLIVIDILFYNAIFGGGRRNQEGGGNYFLIIILILRYVLPIITTLLMLYLSRTREYMADAGSVELLRDNHPLAKALIKIQDDNDTNFDQYKFKYTRTKHEDVRRASYIFDPFDSGVHAVKSMNTLFSTHPSVQDRLHALGFQSKNDAVK